MTQSLAISPISPGFARILTTKKDESELSGDALGSLKSETNQRLGLAGDKHMQPQDEVGVTSKAKLWTGCVITVFTVAFLLFDTMVKVLNLPVAVEGTVRLGYPARLVMYIGIVEL